MGITRVLLPCNYKAVVGTPTSTTNPGTQLNAFTPSTFLFYRTYHGQPIVKRSLLKEDVKETTDHKVKGNLTRQ